MDSELSAQLSALEEKLEQFVSLWEGVRAENRELRTRVAALETENKRLTEKIETACARLEGLMERLPAE